MSDIDDAIFSSLFDYLHRQTATVTVCLKCIEAHKWNFRHYIDALPLQSSVCTSCLSVGDWCRVVPAARARSFLHPFHSALVQREKDEFEHMWSMLKYVVADDKLDEYRKLWSDARDVAIKQAAHVDAAIEEALRGG